MGALPAAIVSESAINIIGGVAGAVPYQSTASTTLFSAAGTTGQSLISGGTGSPTWFAPTAGSVFFAGTSGILQQDNTNLYWDDTNNRLGIGTTAPATLLQLGNTSYTFAASGLSFGDGDTGFYESADDNVYIVIGGTNRWLIAGNDIRSGVANGGAVIRGATASATVPAHTFEEDLDTGVGLAGANILSLIAGGTNGLNVISSGNVGIGTTNPLGDAGDLTLGSAAGTEGDLYLYGSTAGKYSNIHTSNGNLHIDADDSGAYPIFLNYSGGTGGVNFGSGAASTVASVDSNGYGYFNRLRDYSGGNLILNMTGAKPVTKKEHPHLYHTVEGLAIAAGVPTPKAYVIDDSALNAFATGRDPKNSVVVVTTGLLKKLNRQELEGVIAHEMSHIKNYDIRLMMLTTVLVGIVVLLSDFILRSFLWGAHGRRREAGNATAILILIGLILAILTPIVAHLIKLAVSRKREFLADATGALLTRYPEGLASALEKIKGDPDPLVDRANKATAHLFISTPFRREKGYVTNLFSTHPPIDERIKRLRRM